MTVVSRALDGVPVLVTGSTGFIGRNLLPALTNEGAIVHALLRSGGTPPEVLRNSGIRWQYGDIRSEADMQTVARRASPRVAFNLAAYGAKPGEADEQLMQAVNVSAVNALWRALERYDVRLIHTGTCGEYGRHEGPAKETAACQPLTPYAVTKLAGSSLVRDLARLHRREAVVLRLYGPYGPGDESDRLIPAVMKRLLRRERVAVSLGDQLQDFAYVDDHIRALILAATVPGLVPGAIYNVGSGEGVRIRSVVLEIARVVGDDAIGRVDFGARPYRATDVPEVVADISAAKLDLGYVPRVQLSDGIRRTAFWFRTASSLISARTTETT